MLSTAVLVLASVVAVFVIIGRPIDAPAWLRGKVEQSIASNLAGFDLQFDGLSFVIEEGWHPRIRVRDVVLTDVQSGTDIALAEIDAELSMSRLLSAQVSPKHVRVSGVSLSLRRLIDGSFSLSLGDGARTLDRQTRLADVGAELEKVLETQLLTDLVGFEADALTLRYEDTIAERGWTIDGAQVKLTKTQGRIKVSASLALLGGRDYASTLEARLESDLSSDAVDFSLIFEDMPAQDIASQTPALAWLDVLRAPISGALRMALDEAGELGPLYAALQIGRGVVQPNDGVKPVPFNAARSHLTYDPKTASISFQELSVDSDWITANASGTALLQGLDVIRADGSQGLPDALLGQFTITDVVANPMGLYDTPVSIDQAFADFRLRLDPFEFSLGQMVVHDQGQTLRVTGNLGIRDENWDIVLDGHMDGLKPNRLIELWPDRAIPKTRKWIAENVLGGMAENLNLAVRSKPEGGRPDVYVDFGFRDAEVRYLKKMPVGKGGVGYGVLMNNRFTAFVEEGTVQADQGGVVDVAGTSFQALNTRIKKNGPALVRLQAKGTITAALSLLDRPPLSLLGKANLPITLADGLAHAQGEVRFGMIKGQKIENIKYDIHADLQTVRSTHFVKDKVLAFSALKVHATPKDISISGAGRLGAVPFDGTWSMRPKQTPKGQSRLQARVELSERALDEFGVQFPKGSVSGQGKGDLEILFAKDEDPVFSLTSDLSGMALGIGPLGWRKDANDPGALVVRGKLDKPISIDEVFISANGLSSKVQVDVTENNTLKTARFSDFKIGSWLRASGEIQGRGVGQQPALIVQSGQVDMRSAPQSVGKALSAPGGAGISTSGPIQAFLNKVQVSDTITLTDFKGTFSGAGGVQGTFTARVNGGAAIAGTVVPKNGRSAFRITSENAGRVFASAGLLKSGEGGALDLILTPYGPAGTYDGVLDVKNTRVKDIPAFAELLNAISVVGLLEQLNGGGIYFGEVASKFRLSNEKVVITQASAVGSSMGISLDGIIHLENRELDLQGVLSPVYLVNSVGRVFSKKGEGLIGFNFNLRGTAADPKVTVNPLSALTPGFLREIFRRPAPTLEN